jgi:1,2-diacylglycerol 3-alpha-glucosyltransferase
MDRLKIAFYSDSYLPAVDGVVTSILNLKKGLEGKGHEVFIFASGGLKAKREYSSRTVSISIGPKFRPYPQYSVALFPYASIPKVASIKADVVHAHTPFSMGIAAMLAAKAFHAPLAGTYHTFIDNREVVGTYLPGGETVKKAATKYIRIYTRFFYNRCDAVIAPSNMAARALKSQRVRNVRVIPNSIDLDVFDSRKKGGSKMRERLGVSDKDKLVLYVGRMSREKRVETLLMAVHELSRKRSDIKVVLVGVGPAFQYYSRLAKSLRLKNVSFAGFIPNSNLPNYYAAADAVCLPSTFETQGMVAIEAMAMGKPVVGAASHALNELIKDGKNGERFKPGDYISCSHMIEKVLNNSGAYTKNAIRTAESFSLEIVTAKTLRTYNLIMH